MRGRLQRMACIQAVHAVSLTPHHEPGATMSLVGTTAPDFTLLDPSRSPVSLSSYRGQKVVLAFFPGAFTGVCTAEMCALRDGLAGFNSLGATVLAVCVDSPYANGVFTEQNALNFPVLSDYNRVAVDAYGIAFENFAGMDGYVAANRCVFIVNEEGTITYQWFGPHLGAEPDYAAIAEALA